MPNVLVFTESAQLVSPPIEGGLPEGLVVQLWIRRTGEGAARPIVELAGASSRIVLGTGVQGNFLQLSVITGDKTQQLAIPGGLPIDRWVQVRATLAPNGKASLQVNGARKVDGELPAPGAEVRTVKIGRFAGELAQVQVWRHATPGALTWSTPVLEVPRLWAYYPLERVTHDAASEKFVSEDAGPNKRHLTGSSALTTMSHAAPLHDEPSACLEFASDSAGVNLSPMTGVSGNVTLEAWVRLDGDDERAAPVIVLQGAGPQLALVAGGKDGEVALVAVHGGKTMRLCGVKGAISKGEWKHVAATIETRKAKGPASPLLSSSLAIEVCVQGVTRASTTIKPAAPTEIVTIVGTPMPDRQRALRALLGEAILTRCRLGGALAELGRFRGEMLEARVWRTGGRERLERMWLARARGDEDALVVCYRLDALVSQKVEDIGERRGHGVAAAGVSLKTGEKLPLAATTGATPFRLHTRGKLVQEVTPAGPWNMPLLAPKKPTRATNELFDASVEVRGHDGAAVREGAIEVRVDRPLTALTGAAGEAQWSPWNPDETHVVPLSSAGRVRLRFRAQDLACPTIRVRVAGAPGGVWTVIRPDAPVQAKLAAISGPALTNPGEGRRSPMPVGSTASDAEALAEAFRQLGSQFHQRPATQPQPVRAGTSRAWYDVIVDTAEEGWEWTQENLNPADLGDAIIDLGDDALAGATRTAKKAGQLVKRAGTELDALRAKAAGAKLRLGGAAISALVDSADAVAIEVGKLGSAGLQWVEIIGVTIIDGAEAAWRVAVSGIDEALAAIKALIRRIAAKVEDFIELLAYLFAWDDFLAASDEVHALLERSLSQVRAKIPQVGAYKQKLADALRTGVEEVIGKRSIGDLFGLEIEATTPSIEPYDYVMEKLQEALDSLDLVFKVGEETTSPGIAAPDAATIAASNELAGKLPTAKLADVVGLLGTPVSELLAGNGALADGSSSLLDYVFASLIEAGQGAVDAAERQFKARMEVPWLTEMIEEAVLGGRTFSIMRVVSLVAAIFGVVTRKSVAKAQGKGLVRLKSSAKSQQVSDTEWILWASMTLGVINSALLTAKTGIEFAGRSSAATAKLTSTLSGLGGLCIAVRGVLTFGRVGAMPEGTREYASANAGIEVAGGGWTMMSAYVTFKVGDNPYWRMIDLGAYGLLGLGTTTLSVVALASGKLKGEAQIASFSLRCGSWVTSSLMRLSEKYDDKDPSGRLKAATIALAVVSACADIAEAYYGNVSEVEEVA